MNNHPFLELLGLLGHLDEDGLRRFEVIIRLSREGKIKHDCENFAWYFMMKRLIT